MKIGYILPEYCILSGDSNGIKHQALIWANELIKKNHKVEFLNVWGNYKWADFDVIHIFGGGLWLLNFIQILYNKNVKIVISPIIDTNKSLFLYKLSTYDYFKPLRLYSPQSVLRILKEKISCFYARSQYEFNYLNKCYGIPPNKIVIVPLSPINEPSIANLNLKEPFCFHVSSIYQPRKNVKRLIKAAKEFDFKLVLAGNKGTDKEFKHLEKEIGNNKNIKVLGFIDNQKLEKLYNEAKVFALPSIEEGVGLVALDAAVRGCDIVLTNLGAPKEYYGDLAYLVNPYDYKDIGQKIKRALKETKQPALRNHIINEFSLEKKIQELIESYKNIING